MSVGDSIQAIELACELPKTDFLKSTYGMVKIKEISNESAFKDLLGAVLVKISVLAGIKGEIDSFVKQDISKMILNSFKDISFEEIHKAFELERYGEYEHRTEHYQLFDSNYISQVLKKYKTWKMKAKLELNITTPKLEHKVSDFEKKKLREDLVKMIFDEITKTGFSSDAWHLYSDLEVSGKLKTTKEEKSKLYKEQLKIYELEEKSLIRKKYDSMVSKTYLKLLVDKITSKNPVESVSNKCRSIIVSNYLQPFTIDYETFKSKL